MARPTGPRPRRRWLLWAILGVVAFSLLLGAISGFYIDILWFREVGYSSVFWTRLWTRVLLALSFGGVFFVLMYANLLIVRRIRPRYRVYSPEEEAVERYRTAFEPYARWVLPGLSLVFALFAAVGVAAQWEEFQLWRVGESVSFGVSDPVFGRDASFFVLSLPFQKFVQGWLFTSLLVITLAAGGAHYLWGGIRFRAVGERFTPQVKAHLSVLLGLVVLVRAWGYRLGQFDLLVSPRGTVTGASYTDIHAQLPALRALVVIAILCAVLFLVNIRLRGWALPGFALGILVVASIAVGAIYPAIVQRFQVAPQELQREEPFIARNIEFTRRAFGLDKVERRTFPAEERLSAEELGSGTDTNIRLWNPDVLKQAYLQLQRIRPYYEFVDVDVDRYEIDGTRQLVMISPREIAQGGIPGGGQTWQNQHLVYTHGFGATASRVDQVTEEGAPAFVLRDLPSEGKLAAQLTEPRVYFQEVTDVPFVVVGAGADEFDFPQTAEGDARFARYRYEGTGGIEVGGFFRRLALAWHFRDVNLMISSLIDRDSRVLLNTDLTTRVEKIAPFLSYDHDPYAAIVDGRMVWVWDAYTTSENFPYSERVDMGLLSGNAELPAEGNYIRNAVKVVVDAFDGTTTFYVADPTDPIIQAWRLAFPGLFTDLEEAPPELLEHFRYPEDMFVVQAHQYANYHVTDPQQYYAKEDFWAVPLVARDPTQQAAEELEPYYVLLPLPEEKEERFLLFSPFTPADRPNMVAWMAADSDPEDYGRLISFEFEGRNVRGPSQVSSLIAQDTEVARETSLFDQRGSNVVYGDLLAIPIGSSFLYVQPLYLESEQEGLGIPELKRVVVVNGERVSMAETLSDAVAGALGVAPEQPPGEQPPDGVPAGDVQRLLEQAEDHFDRANQALLDGDLATYQREIEAARDLVAEAAELAQGGGR